MEDIDGGLHPAMDGQSLDEDEGLGNKKGAGRGVGGGVRLGEWTCTYRFFVCLLICLVTLWGGGGGGGRGQG